MADWFLNIFTLCGKILISLFLDTVCPYLYLNVNRVWANKLWEGLWLVWNYRGQVPDLIALFTRQFKELAHDKAIRPGSLLTRALILKIEGFLFQKISI